MNFLIINIRLITIFSISNLAFIACTNKEVVTTRTESANAFASKVEFSSFPTLFIGIENSVSYNSIEDSIRFESPTLIVRKIADGRLAVIPTNNRPYTAPLKAFLNQGEKPQLVGQQSFEVKLLPNPVSYFGKFTGNAKAKMPLILASKGIHAKFDQFPYQPPVEILSFSFGTYIDGKLKELATEGRLITTEMKAIIKGLRPGDRIYMEQIKAKLPDETIRSLAPIIIDVE